MPMNLIRIFAEFLLMLLLVDTDNIQFDDNDNFPCIIRLWLGRVTRVMRTKVSRCGCARWGKEMKVGGAEVAYCSSMKLTLSFECVESTVNRSAGQSSGPVVKTPPASSAVMLLIAATTTAPS